MKADDALKAVVEAQEQELVKLRHEVRFKTAEIERACAELNAVPTLLAARDSAMQAKDKELAMLRAHVGTDVNIMEALYKLPAPGSKTAAAARPKSALAGGPARPKSARPTLPGSSSPAGAGASSRPASAKPASSAAVPVQRPLMSRPPTAARVDTGRTRSPPSASSQFAKKLQLQMELGELLHDDDAPGNPGPLSSAPPHAGTIVAQYLQQGVGGGAAFEQDGRSGAASGTAAASVEVRCGYDNFWVGLDVERAAEDLTLKVCQTLQCTSSAVYLRDPGTVKMGGAGAFWHVCCLEKTKKNAGADRIAGEGTSPHHHHHHHHKDAGKLHSEMSEEEIEASRKKMLNAFELFDEDGSGCVNKGEFHHVLTEMGHAHLTEDGFDKMWVKFDADSNGSINYAEFMQAFFVLEVEKQKSEKGEKKKHHHKKQIADFTVDRCDSLISLPRGDPRLDVLNTGVTFEATLSGESRICACISTVDAAGKTVRFGLLEVSKKEAGDRKKHGNATAPGGQNGGTASNFTAEEALQLAAMAAQAGVFMLSVCKYKSVQNDLVGSQRMKDAATGLISARSLVDMLKQAIKWTESLLASSHCFFYVCSEKGEDHVEADLHLIHAFEDSTARPSDKPLALYSVTASDYPARYDVGKGLLGRCLQSGQVIRVDSCAENGDEFDPDEDARVTVKGGIMSTMYIPIYSKEQEGVLGVLQVINKSAQQGTFGPFLSSDEQLAVELCKSLGVTLDNYNRVETGNMQQQTMMTLFGQLHYRDASKTLCEYACKVMGASSATLLVVHREDHCMKAYRLRGRTFEQLKAIPLGKGIAGWCYNNRAVCNLTSPDLQANPLFDEAIDGLEVEIVEATNKAQLERKLEDAQRTGGLTAAMAAGASLATEIASEHEKQTEDAPLPDAPLRKMAPVHEVGEKSKLLTCLLSIPIYHTKADEEGKRTIIGVLQVANHRKGHFGIKEMTSGKKVSAVASSVLVKCTEHHAVMDLNTRIMSLMEASTAMAGAFNRTFLISSAQGIAKTLLEADRASVFMYDADDRMLWTRIAVDALEIRMPANTGIVGKAHMSQRVVNIEDAYLEPVFNSKIDKETGYLTKTVLAAPIIYQPPNGQPPETVGVLQVINKLGGRLFSQTDEKLLTILNSHVAVAIKNALRLEKNADMKEQMEVARTAVSGLNQDVFGNGSPICIQDQALKIMEHAKNEQSIAILALSRNGPKWPSGLPMRCSFMLGRDGMLNEKPSGDIGALFGLEFSKVEAAPYTSWMRHIPELVESIEQAFLTGHTTSMFAFRFPSDFKPHTAEVTIMPMRNLRGDATGLLSAVFVLFDKISVARSKVVCQSRMVSAIDRVGTKVLNDHTSQVSRLIGGDVDSTDSDLLSRGIGQESFILQGRLRIPFGVKLTPAQTQTCFQEFQMILSTLVYDCTVMYSGMMLCVDGERFTVVFGMPFSHPSTDAVDAARTAFLLNSELSKVNSIRITSLNPLYNFPFQLSMSITKAQAISVTGGENGDNLNSGLYQHSMIAAHVLSERWPYLGCVIDEDVFGLLTEYFNQHKATAKGGFVCRSVDRVRTQDLMTATGWEKSKSSHPSEGVWVYELIAEKEQLLPVTYMKSIRHYWTGMQFMRTGRYSTARKEFREAFEAFNEGSFHCHLTEMHVRRLDIMLARPPSVHYSGIWQSEYSDKPDPNPNLVSAYLSLAGTIEDDVNGKGAMRKKLLKKSLAMWMGPVETSNFKQMEVENKAKNKLLGFRKNSQAANSESPSPLALPVETANSAFSASPTRAPTEHPSSPAMKATEIQITNAAPVAASHKAVATPQQPKTNQAAVELRGKPAAVSEQQIIPTEAPISNAKRPYTKPMRPPPPLDNDARSLASLLNRLPEKPAKTARPATGAGRQSFPSGRARASRQKTLQEKKLGFSYPLQLD